MRPIKSVTFSGSADANRTIDEAYGYSTAQFFKRLDTSERAALRTQLFLAKYGVEVEVPALRRRSSLEEIKAFTEHEADVLLTGTPFTLEVKGRPKLRFTSAKNFRYADVSVDTVSGYDAKKQKPLAYVMVSGDFQGGIVLPTFTEQTWRSAPAFDTERRISDNFYFAKKQHLLKRRAWLIDLCKALQNSTSDGYAPILAGAGFDRNALGKLYPSDYFAAV
jgi:hypothetical protein